MTREEFINKFCITPEKCKEIMERVSEIITGEAQEVIEHADYYIDPLAYCDKKMLIEEYGENALEKQEEKEKEAFEKEKNYDRDFAIGNIVRHKDNRDIMGMVLNEHFTDDDGKEKFRAVGSSGGVFNLLSCEDYVWTGINVGYAKYLRRSEEESGDE